MWLVASGEVWSGLAARLAHDPGSGPSPARGAQAAGSGRLCPGALGVAGVTRGRSGRPAPGVCPGIGATTLRAGRGRGQSARAGGARAEGHGPGSPAGPAQDSNRDRERHRRGIMASSGPAGPLLLLVLLAGAARAGLHFRPGQSCYRPLRGDQLSNLGRRSARLGGWPTPGASRALPPLGAPAASLGRPASPDL